MSTCAADAGHGDVFVMWKTVSEDCNLACDYCYYSTCGGRIGRRVRRIDSALLEKFIGEYMAYASRRGGVATFIWQGGEPLLAGLDFFREVVELQIKYARPGMMVSNAVQTNGTLIDEEWARFFRKYNFLVGVSVDGPKEIHDARRVTGSGKGSYDLVMRGIGHLRDAGAEFNILTVVHDGNVDKGRELMEFYRRENFGYVQFIPCMDFRAQEPDRPARYQITPEQYGRFLCETFDVWYNDGRPEISVRFFRQCARRLSASGSGAVHPPPVLSERPHPGAKRRRIPLRLLHPRRLQTGQRRDGFAGGAAGQPRVRRVPAHETGPAAEVRFLPLAAPLPRRLPPQPPVGPRGRSAGHGLLLRRLHAVLRTCPRADAKAGLGNEEKLDAGIQGDRAEVARPQRSVRLRQRQEVQGLLCARRRRNQSMK